MSYKKISVITLAILMLIAMIVPLIKADVTGITLTAPSSPVHISQAGGTVTVSFEVTYDQYSYVSGSKIKIAGIDVHIQSTATNAENLNQDPESDFDPVVFTTTLTVPAGTTPGSYDINIWGKQYPEGGWDVQQTFAGMIIVDPPVPSDTTPPTTSIILSGTQGNSPWYVSPVEVTLSADDNGGSGVQATYYTVDGGSQQTYSGPFTISDDGVHTVTYWSVDNANNEETPNSETIKIDQTAPTITITAPSSLPSDVFKGQVVTVTWTASDATSGLSTDASGTATFDTSNFGTSSVTITATDNAGNTATKTLTINVAYQFGGFLQPINSDGSSIFKAGSTVPVKFQILDANGLPVPSATATIQYVKASSTPMGWVDEGTLTAAAATGGTQFRYDSTSGQYVYNWGAAKGTAGTYRLAATVTLGSATTTQSVYLSLK